MSSLKYLKQQIKQLKQQKDFCEKQIAEIDENIKYLSDKIERITPNESEIESPI